MAKDFLRKNAVQEEFKSKGCGMADHKNLMKALNNKVEDYLDNACVVSKSKPIKKIRITPELIKNAPELNVLPKM